MPWPVSWLTGPFAPVPAFPAAGCGQWLRAPVGRRAEWDGHSPITVARAAPDWDLDGPSPVFPNTTAGSL